MCYLATPGTALCSAVSQASVSENEMLITRVIDDTCQCGTCDTAPHDTTVVRCRRMLASSAARSRPWTSGQHLRVLLLVLAQHLGHRHQRLDLGHLLADVHQLGQV